MIFNCLIVITFGLIVDVNGQFNGCNKDLPDASRTGRWYFTCLRVVCPDGILDTDTFCIPLKCQVEKIPNNGFAVSWPDGEAEDKIHTAAHLHINATVSKLNAIRYHCFKNYMLVGKIRNFCLGNNKWAHDDIPQCKPRCRSSLIPSRTVQRKCYTEANGARTEVDCNKRARPGTIAHIECQPGYENLRVQKQVLICDNEGNWSPEPMRCTPICGQVAPKGLPHIIGGKNIAIEKVPWHVGIYQKVGENSEFVQQCGGTIINEKVVISAAHCFWDRNNDQIIKASEYIVVTGKYYRDLNDPNEQNKFQKLNIKGIHLQAGYNDYEGLYGDDIAVLVLDDYIDFKVNVAPACIVNYKYEDKTISSTEVGRVAGWGLTESGGVPSATLKEIELPVIPREECRKEFAQDFRPFLTSDKFCAGYLTGIGVCQGDSGGGLVFPKEINGRTVYYLRGIVSNGPTKQNSCDNEKYAVFTNTAHFWDLIEHHEVANRQNYDEGEGSKIVGYDRDGDKRIFFTIYSFALYETSDVNEWKKTFIEVANRDEQFE